MQHRFFKVEAYLDGQALLFHNTARYSPEWLMLRVRLAAATVSLLPALLVLIATREVFSTGAAFVAMALPVFASNLLAYGGRL